MAGRGCVRCGEGGGRLCAGGAADRAGDGVDAGGHAGLVRVCGVHDEVAGRGEGEPALQRLSQRRADDGGSLGDREPRRPDVR